MGDQTYTELAQFREATFIDGKARTTASGINDVTPQFPSSNLGSSQAIVLPLVDCKMYSLEPWEEFDLRVFRIFRVKVCTNYIRYKL